MFTEHGYKMNGPKVLASYVWGILSLTHFVFSYGRSFFYIMPLFFLAFDNPDLTISLMICIVESNSEKKNDKRKLIRIIIMDDALNCLYFLTV